MHFSDRFHLLKKSWRDNFAKTAQGQKMLEDAIEIRKRIILSFEEAEYEDDLEARRAKLTFMIIGGGQTGNRSLPKR